MQQARILIVDDEKSITQMIEMVLKKEGFRHIYKAYSAREALELLNRQEMDIILLDVMLPDQSGFELCPKVRDISRAHIIFFDSENVGFGRFDRVCHRWRRLCHQAV